MKRKQRRKKKVGCGVMVYGGKEDGKKIKMEGEEKEKIIRGETNKGEDGGSKNGMLGVEETSNSQTK